MTKRGDFIKHEPGFAIAKWPEQRSIGDTEDGSLGRNPQRKEKATNNVAKLANTGVDRLAIVAAIYELWRGAYAAASVINSGRNSATFWVENVLRAGFADSAVKRYLAGSK